MADFNVKFSQDANFEANLSESNSMNASFGSVQVIEVGDYNALSNKPSIEMHEARFWNLHRSRSLHLSIPDAPSPANKHPVRV